MLSPRSCPVPFLRGRRARRYSRGAAFFAAVAMLGAAGCDRLPRDPEKTLEHVRAGRLRVGLVEHHPWVVRHGDEPAGVEVELIRGIAQELKATPEWHWGGEQEQMEQLENYELDLLAGGFTRKSPWRKKVGFTAGYHKAATAESQGKREEMAMAVPPGENAWMKALDTFFAERRPEGEAALGKSTAAP